jgi:pilus assembly protein Flp/PilA
VRGSDRVPLEKSTRGQKSMRDIMNYGRARFGLATSEEGATAVEYGILVALIAAVIIAIVLILGNQLQGAFQTVSDGLTSGGITT